MIGELIGNYRIVSELGRGGMGMVYRAEHVQLGRPAAIKMLLPQMSNDAGIVQRFFNEARAASAIDHPGIVEVYDFGTHTDGRAYLVMELLKGESLEHRLQRGPMAPLDGASIVAQVCGALAAAHARGIVHRDLKPDNIFLVPNELMTGGIQVKLLDFGIAKLADDQGAGLKTQTGALIGTPAYMSPEQCMGKPDLDHRTDMYALGCILFHVLCGRPPFVSDQGTGMLIAAQLRDQPPDLRSLNPQVPDALAAIVARLLEKEPAARFQSAGELRAALIAAGANAPTTVPPPPVMATGATIASTPPVSERYTGPEAFGATTAPTTGSGSAAQIVGPPPATAQRGSKLGAWIVVGGLLFAIAGVGVFVAVRGTDEPHAASAPVASQPAPPPASPPAPPVLAAAKPVPAELPSVGGLPCPDGQSRSSDTGDHCCWPDQAWSSAKQRCVGTPTCPSGTKGRGEQCVAIAPAVVAPPKPRPPELVERTPDKSAAPALQLGAASYAPGGKIAIRFASPVSSPPKSRAWITVVEASAGDSSYGTWQFVDDAATTATMKAPTAPGAYEIRLHTDYPAKSTNVQRRVAFKVAAEPVPAEAIQTFAVATTTVAGGGGAEIRFPGPMHALPGERYWITVVPRGSNDTTWGSYLYVPDGARGMKLPVPATAGDYEIRLHANYPKKSTNVVHRVAITVGASN